MSVSCIIPYFNESGRIHKVLRALEGVDQVSEILLVDDGSTDNSVRCSDPRARHMRLEKNSGKAEAMRYGFCRAREDIILFLDADLNGINADNIRLLLEPLLSGRADICISQREYSSFFDVVSGERVLRKNEWAEFFEKESFERNAAEIIMNRHIMLKGLRPEMVKWPNVKQDYKSMKIGFLRGMWKDIRSVRDWMVQMGSLNFSSTYLFFWLIILSGRHQNLSSIYRRIYVGRFSMQSRGPDN